MRPIGPPALLVLLASCTAELPLLEGGSLPRSGYVEATFDLRGTGIDADTVQEVRIDGVRAYDLRVGDEAVTLTTQGAPGSGLVDVTFVLDEGEMTWPELVTVSEPVDPVFERMAVIGASLGQGVQAGVPTVHGILHSPSHVLAQAGGAHLPLPMLVEGLFPSMQPSDIGPPPECRAPDVVPFLASAAVAVVGKLNDPELDRIGFYLGREDPDIEPTNVAVGGSQVSDLAYGPPNDFAKQFLAKLVYAPYADIAEPITVGQLDLVEEMSPTLIACFDTYGNDLIISIVDSEDVDTNKLTPIEEMAVDLPIVVDRLAATDAAVYLANLPRPTLLPITRVRRDFAIERARQRAIDRDEDVDAAVQAATEAVDGRIALVEEHWVAYGEILDEAAAAHGNVHVVDVATAVSDIDENGLLVDGTVLEVGAYRGLLSTDGTHFSDVGYAMLANEFIEAINANEGADIPLIDLGPVLEGDPYSPSSYAAGGVDVTACTP